ncbi:MAG: NAD(P)/FAD-dependent oxidoreductase [Chitinispirillales bacterium]|nr:NAD(P)/FAD-dependent oxidoreductase [Chitinispirillales bacterium]
MENKKYDIAVIGAGLGGLVASAILAKNGRKILLVEQHSVAGGCATTFKRKGFSMEVGLHEIDGLYPKDNKVALFEKLDVFKNVEFLKSREFYKVQNTDKTIDFTMGNGVEAVQTELCRRFPEDKKGIKKFFSTLLGIRRDLYIVTNNPKLKFLILAFSPFIIPHLIGNYNQTLGKFLDKYIKSENLKLILAANTNYFHDNPYELSIIWFASAQANYIIGGGHFVKGGSQNLSNYFAKIIKENGGELVFNTAVTQIITDETAAKVVGIKAKNQKNEVSEFYADKIIANCAIPVLYDLLPPIQSGILREKYKKFKPACSLLSVYIGFSKSLNEVGVNAYSTIILSEKFKTLNDLAVNMNSDFETVPIIFVDYGQIDDSMSPKGKSCGSICLTDYIENWENLTDEEYKSKKKNVAEILINRLNNEFNGIKDLIEGYEVGTPRTICNYTGNPFGSAYGFAQIPGQMITQRPKHKTPIKNLYISSAYSIPGGGFSGTILGGAMCASEIIKEYKKS